MFEQQILHNHLISDGIFQGNDTLYIIDDYHFNNTKDDATIEFYVDAFNNTGVRRIVIYLQAKHLTRRHRDLILNYCQDNMISYYDYIAFQTLVGVPFRRNGGITAGEWTNTDLQTMNNNAQNALDFIRKMGEKGIEVHYIYYDNLNFRPPFHGRYWITPNGKGYIVDGSLNTIEKNRVFAQLMDPENYEIIYRLYREFILENAKQYPTMNEEFITNLRNRINSDYQYNPQD